MDEKHVILFLFLCHFFFPIILVKSTQIPFINNAILQAGYYSNSTVIPNLSCDQCLCYSQLSYSALNCFPNSTCQLFLAFPPTYQIEVTPGARLYFPQRLFPNVSQCCMPNINDLLIKMRAAIPITVSVAIPRDLVIDDHGYLVTVEMKSSHLDRFDATNLTRIDQTIIQTNLSRCITFNQGAYYVATYDNSLTVINSTDLTTLTNMILTGVNGPRGIIFLNNGQTMIVSSITNNSLAFFNRSSVSPIQYTFSFSFSQSINCSGPHGLWRVNDTFFYMTSYTNNSICSMNTSGLNTLWNEIFVYSAPKMNNTGMTHLTIDECGRFWLSFETDTTLIYDQYGNLLGNYTIPNSKIFDIKILDNYLMYFSDKNNQTIRLDPNIQC